MFNKTRDVTIIKTTILALFIFNIATFKQAMPKPGIHLDVIEYVEDFNHHAKFFISKDFKMPVMDIDIGDTRASMLDIGTIGWCMRGKGTKEKPHKIMLNSISWGWFSHDAKEQLIFHEFGHCVLDKRHRDTFTPYRIPVSIMSTVMFDTKIYTANKHLYMKELFTHKDKNLDGGE